MSEYKKPYARKSYARNILLTLAILAAWVLIDQLMNLILDRHSIYGLTNMRINGTNELNTSESEN